MEGVDVIYWINLKRAKERRKHMENLFKDPVFDSVEKIRFHAVDTPRVMKKFTLPLESVLSVNHKVTEKEYACLASHLDAIRMFSNSKFETALVLEDDVSLDLKPYWHKPIQQVMEEAPKDWDILKLQHQDHLKKGHYVKLTYPCYDEKFNTKNTCNWGTSAYLIHKRAALKLMKLWNGKTYRLPNTFHVADYLLYDLLTTYVYKYPYFLDRKDNDTQIQPNYDRVQNNRTRRRLLSNMKTQRN
jgi:GR25 family glycosyltransferase involved in LPS biosynthesis